MSGLYGKKRRPRSASGASMIRGIGRVNRRGSHGRSSGSILPTSSSRRRHARSSKPRRRLLDGINQQRLRKIIIIGAFSVVALIGLVIIIVSANTGGKELESSVIENDSSGTVITAEDTGATLTLAFGGAVKLQDSIIDAARMGEGYDFNNYLSELTPVMSADISIVNLLGSVDAKGGDAELSGYPKPNYPAQLAPALKNIGVTHAVVANSQALQSGFEGLSSTIDNLAANDITALGGFKNAETGSTVYVKRMNSISVGIGAYNCLTDSACNDLINGQLAAGVTTDQLSYCINQVSYSTSRTEGGKSYSAASDVITKDVEAMRAAGAQFVIICLNWGSASTTTPVSEMGNLAQRLIDLGVDVTLGGGSDVAQKVTVREHTNDDGTKKKCYVFYSLGNLLSDCDSGHTEEKQAGMVVNMTLERAAGEKTVSVASVVYHPVYINHDSSYEDNNTHLKYRSMPAAKYYYAESLPDVFSSKSQWQSCKKSFDRIKSLVGDSLQAGSLVGDDDAGAVQGGDVGGADML